MLLQEMLGQQEHVVARSRSGGASSADDRQPEEQIGAEPARVDQLAQRAVGGRDDPHIDGMLAHRAQAAHGAALQHPQQLGLQCQVELADLVEEQGAAARGLDQADALLARVGERAALVAEQLALDQRRPAARRSSAR